jgi:iron complex outermembrane recepter protein
MQRFALLPVIPLLSMNGIAAHAQTDAPAVLPSVTVSATRVERDSFDLPASIDAVDARNIREARPQVNLSESLNRIPGIVVQNRQNYAQDLQISSRGFGARSTFGVRGLRLYADGIPATMPDGQGQAASFNLSSAQRIEVLRGPFSTLYGNSAGGVVQIFTADGPPEPTVSVSGLIGSNDTTKFGAQVGGQRGAVNYMIDASRFETEGYRDHSAARRDHLNAKFKVNGDTRGTLTFVVNILDQPETQDPLGLTAAQVALNRRQPGANALAFNTRKSNSQGQAGLVYDVKLSAEDSIQARGYAGDRQVTQFLAIPLATQAALTHSGGVVDLDRSFGGTGLRWVRSTTAAGMPLTLQAGVDYERMAERRRGFLNNLGISGALKRDEKDVVTSTDFYAQMEWAPGANWLVLAGVRRSRVNFDSQDYFLAPGNGDDSGSIKYARTTPAAGVTYKLMPSLNVYANIGKGFETPTFAELAYRPGGATGLNLALRPSDSVHREVGLKALLGAAGRVNAALFRIDTKQEIVVDTSVGGRATFKNASRTERQGLELAWENRFSKGFEAAVAYTLVRARFTESFTTLTGTPAVPVTVAAGSRMPGVPPQTLYGELIWRHQPAGFHIGAEVRHSGKIYVNDQNSEFAGAYTVGNVRAGLEQRGKSWTLTEFVRVDNITGRNYIGSVIVAEGNGRYYEPAPGRALLVGVSANLRF